MSKPSTLIFQLGTNNWQRPKKDGSGELEFAPGSGVLHEAHHNAYNEMQGVKCYSMYPSQAQGQPTDPNADYAVFELDHPIPICESASPNSSKRWHGMSEQEFKTYCDRLENEVHAFMKKCEAKAGTNFSFVIAHHSFVNPLTMKRVIARRVAEGLPKCPLYCFVHGTALKMYRWELGPKETDEQKSFPMRFHKMILDDKLFDDQVNGIDACFVISEEQKGGIEEIFPMFPQSRVIVAPNGINVEKFKPREKTLTQVITEQTRSIIWPAAAPSEQECAKYKRCFTFVGKAAEWKRQAALLHAMGQLEKEFGDVALLCAGTGPDAEIKKLVDLCEALGLKNTYLIGPRGQDVLAEMYTVASLGVFPSFKEPFGLVFVECMACKTPVIGANSGGPKDFVVPAVGELVPEPPETKDLNTVPLGVKTLGNTLAEAISRALKEDWKKTKGEACIKLAHDKFTVASQVSKMLEALKNLDNEEKSKLTVLVCGGGNAAQVATAMFAARYDTYAISLYADEAAKWKEAMQGPRWYDKTPGMELSLDTGRKLVSQPTDITNDPAVAAKANVIILAVPSFAHGQYFQAFEPYIKPGTIVACMPARSGGDILFASIMKAKAETLAFVGFETLPWACRFTEWGKRATILGTKGSILAAVTPPSEADRALATLQGLLGVFPMVTKSPNNLGISLRNPGQVIHPGVMYGRWCPEKWDGKPLKEKPLFYQGVDEFTETVLLGLSGEVQEVRKKVESLVPGFDLKDACTLHQWYLDSYDGQMTDPSTLKGSMNTCSAYTGLTHPMKTEADGTFMPDLKYRYIAEDVPTGLCFTRGLAEILGVPTPTMDKVLTWAQDQIGMSLLVNGKMSGPDVPKTRAPQAVNISTVEDFFKQAKIK